MQSRTRSALPARRVSGLARQRRLLFPAGSGPTKAHKLHLKHVIKQFRALEKRLASLLNKHAAQFLELLGDVRERIGCTTALLTPFHLVLETTDGKPFDASTVVVRSRRRRCEKESAKHSN